MQANAHYRIVTGLYSQIRANNHTETELRQAFRSGLKKMFCRISADESIIMPFTQLEKIYVRVSNQQTQDHVAHLKALIK